MKVLLFKPATALGDNVVFLPLVQSLKRLRPDWHLVLVIDSRVAELYRGPHSANEIIVDHDKRFATAYRRPWEFARWVAIFRGLRPDMCILPFDQGNVAHLVARLSGARVRVGSLDHVRFRGSVTRAVPMPADACAATWNWQAGTAAVGAAGSAADWPERPPPPDLSHLHGAAPAPRSRPRIVVHPGAAGLNSWTPERFAEAAGLLAGECEVAWIRHGPGAPPAPAGTSEAAVGTLAELAAAVWGADLFLGNNSGPMHVANALGLRGVAVTGPSALGWNPYWHRERWSVLRHPDLYCAPCERINTEVRTCSNRNHPMACLELISPKAVANACLERLRISVSGKP